MNLQLALSLALCGATRNSAGTSPCGQVWAAWSAVHVLYKSFYTSTYILLLPLKTCVSTSTVHVRLQIMPYFSV